MTLKQRGALHRAPTGRAVRARAGSSGRGASLVCLWLSGAALVASPAEAAQADDIAAIRAEMQSIKRDYNARLEALESRLEQAEAAAGPAPASGPQPALAAAPSSGPTAPVVSGPQPSLASGPQPASGPQAASVASAQTSAPAAATGRAPIGANAYNPGISVVLNGSYAAFENDPETARIPGFVLGEEAGLDPRGFSLGESELALNANVDHRLYANLIFAINDEGEVEVEEGYVQTTSLPGGFTLKGGKFFSGVGYLNEKHAHDWDFIDAPLPYRAFLGNQYGDPGLQVRWLAPTDFYLEAGGEVFRGDTFPSGGAANKGSGAYAGYVQSGGDIGVSSSWLAKVSYLRTLSDARETDGDVFTGADNLGIVSLVYKWAPKGNPTRRNLIVNGEYFFNKEKGDFNGVDINLSRTGWYAQAVYQFQPNWRVGARYARIGSEAVPLALAGGALDDFGRSPDAVSAMIEYDTSEFSRLRLMYTFDNSDIASNNELIARYTVIFGPHGAHRF